MPVVQVIVCSYLTNCCDELEYCDRAEREKANKACTCPRNSGRLKFFYVFILKHVKFS